MPILSALHRLHIRASTNVLWVPKSDCVASRKQSDSAYVVHSTTCPLFRVKTAVALIEAKCMALAPNIKRRLSHGRQDDMYPQIMSQIGPYAEYLHTRCTSHEYDHAKRLRHALRHPHSRPSSALILLRPGCGSRYHPRLTARARGPRCRRRRHIRC